MSGSIGDTGLDAGDRLLVEAALAEQVLLGALDALDHGRDGHGVSWRERLDGVYSVSREARDAAFSQVALEAFDALGHRRALGACLELMPRLGEVARIVRVAAPRPGQPEGADLVATALPRIEVTLLVRPRRFGDGTLRRFVLLELEHLEESLDPAFGYDRFFAPLGSPNARRMASEILKELWAARAWNALEARGVSLGPREAPVAALPGLDVEGSVALVELAHARATFCDLARAATAPIAFLEENGRKPTRKLMPSAPCPLCGFPTWAWAADAALAAAAPGIAAEFPGWRPANGACERCVEAYVGACA